MDGERTRAVHQSKTRLAKWRDLVVASLDNRGDDLIGADLLGMRNRHRLGVKRDLHLLHAGDGRDFAGDRVDAMLAGYARHLEAFGNHGFLLQNALKSVQFHELHLECIRRVEDLEQFMDDALAFIGLLATQGSGDTAIQVIRKNDAVELFEGALDGLRLLEDVDAIGIFLNHPLDAAHMPLDAFESVDQLRFLFSHRNFLPYPLPGGMG